MEENLTCTDFCTQYKTLVQKIVQIRTDAGFSQQFLAEMAEVDRRKIIEFEKAVNYDIDLLLKLCNKLSIELELTFKIF